MPLVTLVLVFGMDPYLQSLPEVFVYMGVVVLVNTLAPAVSIFVLYRRGLLSDLDIRNRKERSLPFFLVLAYFIMTYVLLVTSPSIFIPLIYLDMWMGLMVSIGLALAVTRRFKISMHMLGQGGTLGTIMGVQAVNGAPMWELNAVLIFLAGWVGFARIKMGVHRHIEVYTGYLLGFIICFASVWGGWGG
ncbi:MAG TPA: hypothetical protein DDZ19_05430 [Flavobacteriales bacterium]|jgi:hypothetical protein|nr:hypothetical protein [Flavobacteriales bacterium]